MPCLLDFNSKHFHWKAIKVVDPPGKDITRARTGKDNDTGFGGKKIPKDCIIRGDALFSVDDSSKGAALGLWDFRLCRYLAQSLENWNLIHYDVVQYSTSKSKVGNPKC